MTKLKWLNRYMGEKGCVSSRKESLLAGKRAFLRARRGRFFVGLCLSQVGMARCAVTARNEVEGGTNAAPTACPESVA